MQKNEEKILFHALGYDYEPRWNDDRGGYRNYFCTTGNGEDNDYITIQELVKDGYMEFVGNGFFGSNYKYFRATQTGIDYVVDLWQKKKKENKPTRSKRMTITEIIKSYPKYFEGRFGCMDRRNSIYFEITEHKIKCKYPIQVYYDDYDNGGESFSFKTIDEALDYADKYFSHKKLRVTD